MIYLIEDSEIAYYRGNGGLEMDQRICIIGAGISGLSAGYQLVKAGLKPVIFEKESFVGGRMSSETVEDFVIDKGAYTLSEFHRGTMQMIREIGIEKFLQETSGTSSTFSEGKEYQIKIGSPVDFLKYKLLSMKNKKDMVNLFLYATSLGKSLNLNKPTEKTFELEEESAAKYLLREYDDEILETIAYPIFCEIFLGTPENNSKAAFLATIRNLTHFKIFSLDQGLGMLPEYLSRTLNVKLNSPVFHIRPLAEQGPYQVDLGGDSRESLIFDIVIFAIPPAAILEVFEDLSLEVKEGFKQVEYAPSVVVSMATEQPFPGTSFINNLLRKDFKVLGNLVFDHHKGIGHVPPGKGLATVILAESASRTLLDAPEEVINRQVMEELDRLFRGFSKKVIFSKIYQWKYGVVQLKPGALRQQGLTRKFLEDCFQHLYFVGDGLYRSSIEVQVYTALNVASQIIKKFKN